MTGIDAIASAEKAQEEVSDDSVDAIDAIIEHPYTSLDELKAGISYLVDHHRKTGDGDIDAWLTRLVCRLAGKEENRS